MAQMYPNRLRPETRSYAEGRLYEAFRDTLSDEYTVFHSVAWLRRYSRGGAQDGEADFIIAHPALGFLVLEVKGGMIRYDGVAAQWYSNQQPIQDPFEQAKRNKYSLLEKLKELPYWQNRWLTLGHAVAFPDGVVARDLRLDAPEAIILGRDDLQNVSTWIASAFAYWRTQDSHSGTPGREGVSQLVQLLSPSWELHVPLALEFEDEEQAIIRLTEEQFNLLDFLNAQRRAAIAGCAGSGKTTLALEKAKRLADQGFRVLLTCYNRYLADYLSSDSTLPPGVTIRHFHSLCTHLARQAGLADRLAGDWKSQAWYDESLPELLVEAVDILGPQYDAVVVDEGQDFQENWWLPLMYLLDDPDQGIFYVFYDDNQTLYQGHVVLPPGLPNFPLTRNCRNTQRIHQTFLPFYRGAQKPDAKGPEGREPEIYFYQSAHDLKEQLRRILHHLVMDESVISEDIVLLTPRSRSNSLLHQWDRLGNLRLTEAWPPASDEIFTTTVHSFKGLESPVIILADLRPSDHQDLHTLLYVSCSRARNHLIILADAAIPHEVQQYLRASV